MKDKKEKMQKAKKENLKNQNIKQDKKEKNKKKENKKPNKFIETIKKKWLIDGTKTFILIAIIVAIFIGINILMQDLELTPLDFSQEKLYTLTDESKEKVKDINKAVKIYFVGYSEDDADLTLAKQYKNINEKIQTEAVDANSRPDLAEKYGIENGTEGIIIECGEKYKVLTSDDLVTYDTSTYETISIAEEKLTSAIMSVTSDKIPKVYFLIGYSNFSLNENMSYLNMYLENEINEIDTLDILKTGKVPDDCDTLVITSPSKDFDDVATNAIKNYINREGNLLWLNAAMAEQKELPNVNSILEIYGIKPFESGVIRETDSSKMAMNSPDFIIPDIKYSTITKDLYNTTGAIFVNATKINVDENKLEELNVTKTDLMSTSQNSYFRTNFNIQTDAAQENEEKGTFLVGAELQKTLSEGNEETGENAKTSKLIIYGENYFVSDNSLSQNAQAPLIAYGYNKDLALNSIAYLVDREEDITVRKNTGTVTYTPTEEQDNIIKTVIFTIPILIIIIGIVVWQVRRRKK